MSRTRIIRHPPGRKHLEAGLHGHGGPQPGPGGLLGPALPATPVAPRSPASGLPSDILGQLGAVFQAPLRAATTNLVAAGEVFLGVVVLLVGLLMATGQMGRIAKGTARAGLFAAPRGAIR